jgi:hypothetical protein
MLLALSLQPTHFLDVIPPMNRLPLIILAVLVLGSAGFGVAQLDQVHKLRQSVLAWEKERTDLQKRIWDLQKRNSELENQRLAARTAPVVAATDADAAGEESRRDANDAPPRPRNRNGADRFGALMANPEAQKLMAVQQKAALDGRYSSLFKQLQLNPADLEKFKNLLVEKQTAVMDVMAAARAEGLTGRENRDQINQLVQNAQTEAENNIRSTLGDAAYAQYQGYEATAPQRAVVSQLDQRLSYSSTPLTDAQSQQLVQILAATAPANTSAGRTTGGGGFGAMGGGGGPGSIFGGGGTSITAEAVTQAQGVLSAQQISALQALQQEQQASALLRQQMRANFQTPAQGTPASPSTTPTPARTSGSSVP